MTWAKGQSGNPKGTPKRKEQFAPIIRRVLRSRAGPDDPTEAEAVVHAMIAAAKAGDMVAAKFLVERMDGLLARPVEIAGEGGGRVVVELAWREGERADA